MPFSFSPLSGICLRFFAALFSTAALLACSPSADKESAPASPEQITGLFEGTLPCENCPGIVTRLTLEPDHTAALTRLYLDSDDTSETDYGRWETRDGMLTVITNSHDQLSGSETWHFRPVSDTGLVRLDSHGQPDTKSFLGKATPLTVDHFAGRYHQGSAEAGAYRQTLILSPLENRRMQVTITQTGGKGKGCDFKGIGNLVNNQLEVDLTRHHPDMQAVMVIRPLREQDGMNIASSRFEERFDLMYFCGGGGTLAGDYIGPEASRAHTPPAR